MDQVEKTEFNGLLVLNPIVFEDDRGIFFETYRDYTLNNALGFEVRFVQENQSVSFRNVFRGFHFQTGKFVQSKLVKVVDGAVLDIVIDLRPNEPTYGKHHMELISSDNRKQLFVPQGFAHGFLTLSDRAIFQYKCDNYYNKEYEGGINPLDPNLGINFELSSNIKVSNFIINQRDRSFPNFKDLTKE